MTRAAARKAVLRPLFERRLALAAGSSVATRRAVAEAVASRVLALPEVVSARRVLTCLSFGDELDTWSLLAGLLTSGRRVCVPRADPRDRQLHVHPYPCELVTLSFGLRQPARQAPELPAAESDSAVDVALVLGLGFDRRGYRLGYGAGYFDRFLAGRAFPAIGVACEAQLVARLPVEPHDIPMAAVVTERAVYRRAAHRIASAVA
jgi:5-formyltetrahydrofolate cyclo-ligase